MNSLSIVLVSALVSTGAAGATVVALTPTTVAGSGEAVDISQPSDVAQLRAELAAQGELLRDLAAKLDMRAPRASTAPARTSATNVEDVVRSVLAEERARPTDSIEAELVETSTLTAHDALAHILQLRGSGRAHEVTQKYWNELRDAGLMDEVVAAFEEYAELNPEDPEAQVLLGNAYIQRLQSASGSEAGRWAVKADGAYTDALALDDHNWEARFSKAVSLSFWPPIFGKQQAAISQFETLLEQQANAVPESGHAQTYVYLGNLYQQQGDVEKAKEIWANGLAAFPDDTDLLSKLGG